MNEEINERLINEYISKVGCCDECFASVYCTVNGLRESRVPQDYFVNNIKRYFSDKAKPVEERSQGEWGKWIRLDLAKRVIAKFKGYLDEDMIERIQIALEKEYEAEMKGGAE